MQSRLKIIVVFVIVYLAFLHSFTVNAQARLVMNNNAFMVIDNSAILVLEGSSNAITLVGTGGNIISENEFDRIQWHTGINPGHYTIPFTTTSGTKIPFSLHISVGLPEYGYFRFSTYQTPDWQNSNALPSDVTHFNNAQSLADNSANAIDRFWMIEPHDYTNFGMLYLDFTYDDAEHLSPGNTINEMNLGAQAFNFVSDSWGDFVPTGTLNTVTNTVNFVPFPFLPEYRSWTLVDSDNPMPVELLDYDFECKNDLVELNWTTATETNNMYFTVESSNDGIVFVAEQTINGAGNSNMPLNYSIMVKANKYYKLKQTDYNGTTEEIGNLYANCMEANELVYWQAMEKLSDIRISGLEEGELEYQLYDMSGKLIVDSKIAVSGGTQQISLPEFPNGMYTIHFKNNERFLGGKVMMVK